LRKENALKTNSQTNHHFYHFKHKTTYQTTELELTAKNLVQLFKV